MLPPVKRVPPILLSSPEQKELDSRQALTELRKSGGLKFQQRANSISIRLCGYLGTNACAQTNLNYIRAATRERERERGGGEGEGAHPIAS